MPELPKKERDKKSAPKRKTATPRAKKTATARSASTTPAPAASPVFGEPTHEEIARRAYDLYLNRGPFRGSAVDDWLRAERELRETRCCEAEAPGGRRGPKDTRSDA